MGHKNDSLYRANTAALLVDPANGKIGLVRAKYYDITEWDSPKGGVENGESWENTILREIQEELGLASTHILRESAVVILYDWPEEKQAKFGERGQVRKSFWCVYNGDPITLQEEEIEEFRWFNFAQYVQTLKTHPIWTEEKIAMLEQEYSTLMKAIIQ